MFSSVLTEPAYHLLLPCDLGLLFFILASQSFHALFLLDKELRIVACICVQRAAAHVEYPAYDPVEKVSVVGYDEQSPLVVPEI